MMSLDESIGRIEVDPKEEASVVEVLTNFLMLGKRTSY